MVPHYAEKYIMSEKSSRLLLLRSTSQNFEMFLTIFYDNLFYSYFMLGHFHALFSSVTINIGWEPENFEQNSIHGINTFLTPTSFASPCATQKAADGYKEIPVNSLR